MGEHGGHPAPIEQDPEQAWFWTEEWQAGEREADIQQAARRGIFFDSDEEFVRALRAVMYARPEIPRAS
jgi:hypothetical protein